MTPDGDVSILLEQKLLLYVYPSILIGEAVTILPVFPVRVAVLATSALIPSRDTL